MIELFLFIITGLSLLIAILSFLAVWRLNKYIQYTIEDKLEEQGQFINNIIQTLRIITREDLVSKNGRVKKPYMIKSEEL